MDEGNENVMGVRQQFSQNQDWREQNKISTEEASEPRALRCFDMGEELIIPLFSNEDRIMGGVFIWCDRVDGFNKLKLSFLNLNYHWTHLSINICVQKYTHRWIHVPLSTRREMNLHCVLSLFREVKWRWLLKGKFLKISRLFSPSKLDKSKRYATLEELKNWISFPS